eukprot:UN01791
MMAKQIEAKRNGKTMRLSDYGVYNNVTMHAALRLKGGAEGPSAGDFDIKEVETLGAEVVKGNCIYGLNEGCYEDNIPKAKLPCGCIMCADCMKWYVNKQIDTNAAITLVCGDTSCGKNLDIALAYAVAGLTVEERNNLNARMASHQFERPDSMISYCPQGKCRQFVFRENSASTRIECGVCHRIMCWKCKKEFKGKQDGRCGNNLCDDVAHITLLLAQAKVKDIYGVKVTDTRICPNKECCAVNVHETACKHMTCKNCKHEYCHICLQKYPCNSATCKVAPEQEITSDMKFNN